MALETDRSKIARRLEREGWVLGRHGGDHDIFTHPERTDFVVLPRHRKVSSGVARKVAKKAGWI